MDSLHSAAGLCTFVAIAWLIGENRRAARLSVAAAGIALQIALAALLTKLPALQQFFAVLNDAVQALQAATAAGTSFVFGYLGGGPLPFEEKPPGSSFVFAFRALPLILVISALSALLTFWRILPWIVRGFATLLERSMGVGGAIGLGAAANVFFGMVEGPLFIRPYLAQLTRSELFVLMVSGMATIAGTVLVLYAAILGPHVPNAVAHLLVASVVSVPAAITVALMMIPETRQTTAGHSLPARGADSAMDAIARGTASGVELLINVVAMLIVLVALVALVNALLGLAPDAAGAPLTLQRLFGWVFAPITWLMGIPWAEASVAGALMGTKTVLNEFIAYLNLAELPAGTLSPRSTLMMTYALCGFANFGSLGILIGGLATMAPERRAEITELGLRSIVGGTLATLSTGAVIGILN
ncbi:MAG: NupC/NupG family nucleoside CNT transporter [Gammaproteobacteria bacterium]